MLLRTQTDLTPLMLRMCIVVLALSSCSSGFRSGAGETSAAGGGQVAAPAAMLRIAVAIPRECAAGNHEVEIDGKIQGMFKPGETVVFIAAPVPEHSVTIRRKTKRWHQTLRPAPAQQEWNLQVPCDSLR